MKKIFEKRQALFGVLFLILFLLPYYSGAYITYLASIAGVYAIVAIGLNLLFGFTGLISIGHAAFLGTGAYTTAILLTRVPAIPFPVVMILSGILAAVLGFIVGLPALRLSGHYLAMATMGFGFVMEEIFLHWESLTKGTFGINVPKVSIGPILFVSRASKYYLIFTLAIIMILLAKNILNSKTGRAFIAVRDHEIAAQSMGVNLAWYKTLSFIISAFYAGIGGSLYAILLSYINSEAFNIWISVLYLEMVIVGGIASILGSIFGAVFLTILPEILGAKYQLYQLILQGVILVLALMFMPFGLSGTFWKVRGWATKRWIKGDVDRQGKELVQSKSK
jgi:branched-chain amino acid transport system permease protein